MNKKTKKEEVLLLLIHKTRDKQTWNYNFKLIRLLI